MTMSLKYYLLPICLGTKTMQSSPPSQRCKHTINIHRMIWTLQFWTLKASIASRKVCIFTYCYTFIAFTECDLSKASRDAEQFWKQGLLYFISKLILGSVEQHSIPFNVKWKIILVFRLTIVFLPRVCCDFTTFIQESFKEFALGAVGVRNTAAINADLQ